MTTNRELCEVLADVLGIERELVKDHASALREAGLFPDTDDDRAEPEHASALLISLMAGVPPAKAPDAVRLYANLPLARVRRGEMDAHGGWESGEIPADDPYFEGLRAYGDTFGEVLTCFITWFAKTTEADAEILEIVVGGGLGNATAAICFAPLIEDANVVGDIKFSLEPLGGGTVPDDAPRSRLDRQATIPGSIFSVLREFFTGASDGPRQVFISRADSAHQSQELV